MVSENWKALQAQLGIASKPKPKPTSESPAPSHRPHFKKKRKRDADAEATVAKKPTKEKESKPPTPAKPATGLRIQANLTPILALDAEMVMITTSKSSLPVRHPARVSVVNSHSLTVADMFIRVPEGVRVSDYLTEHSGIKPGDLDREEAVGLQEAREFLRELLKDRKVVGY